MGEANFYYFTCLKFTRLSVKKHFQKTMAPLKKKRVRGGDNAIDAIGGSKSLLALEDDDQKDFERRVADHKKKMNSGSGSKNAGTNIPGVVYLGHVPHGFYEKEMRAFFSQFGAVTRLRLSRSKRTGRSKGYAFLEFRHEEVAKVAADTMNNYLMYRQILKCESTWADKLHPETFKNCHRPFRMPTGAAKSRLRHNADKTPKREQENARARTGKMKKKAEALKAMGIEYECPVESEQEEGQKEGEGTTQSVSAVETPMETTA